ncbi:MAG: nitroreductase [Thermodesulfobacteriota bacterium]
MELKQAIQKRRSVRGFLFKPVPKKIIESLLAAAGRAPSWGNTQPWEVLVVSGEKVGKLGEDFCRKARQETVQTPDFEMPKGFSDPYLSRYRQVGKDLFSILGIEREDGAKRLEHSLNNFRGFGAPVFIYLLLDEKLSPYAILDAGLFIQTLCLSAVERGLGTCILAALTRFPEVIRAHLPIPNGKKILIGIALGYPDQKAPANRYRSKRAPLSDWVTWTK